MSIPSLDDDEMSVSESPTRPMSISPKHMESTDVVDAVMTMAPQVPLHSNNSHNSIDTYRNSPNVMTLPVTELEIHSEDSSLSDGDRTLVESAPDIADMADISSTNNSPAYSDTQMSSPEDHHGRITDFDDGIDERDTLDVSLRTKQYYFKAAHFEEPSTDETSPEPQKMLKVLVDTGMIVGNLKRALEPYVKVPKEYFKIFRISLVQTETECTRLTEGLTDFK